jgi:hypothetical protein
MARYDAVLGGLAVAAMLSATTSARGATERLELGLPWHTELGAAIAEATRLDRPIVSLRLLGRLDEELSCANSRYFRLALYPDPEVARRLGERFVLHWSSERPVPRVTIDFGDGRRLEGTVTGNSAHYLLDRRGRPVDALPGMVSPRAFLGWLDGAEPLARRAAELDGDALAAALAVHHRERRARGIDGLRADFERLGVADADVRLARALLERTRAAADAATAADASALTVTKSIAETPLLEALLPGADPGGGTEALPWAALVALPHRAVRLDESVRASLGERTRRFAAEPSAAEAAVARFERAIALDAARNELLHAVVHDWLAERPLDFATLNGRLYAELFRTPSSDPWLGLGPTEVFAVLTPAGETGARQAEGSVRTAARLTTIQ